MGCCGCSGGIPARTHAPAITTGTPGDFTTASFNGHAAWAGANTQLTITNPAFLATDTVIITPVEPLGSGLAAVRVAVAFRTTDGSITLNRSSGSIANQEVFWRVIR